MNELSLYRQALYQAISKVWPCTCRMSYIERFSIDPSCVGCRSSNLVGVVEKEFQELSLREAEKILINGVKDESV